MADYKLFSADSHVSEPPDLWVSRIPERFRDRAPHVEQREVDGQLQELFVFEGFEPHRLSVGLAAAAMDGDRNEFQRTRGTYANARSGGWDPAARMKDQELDGVDGEVLHTTLGFRLFWLEDSGLQRACFGVYNDWLAEYCSYSPQRLVGLGLISLADVDLAVADLQRCAQLGLRGAMIWNSPPPERPYTSDQYDPFWAAAQDLDMPLGLHALTGHDESRIPLNWFLHNVVQHFEIERTLATLILSGVLERFPRLKIVSVENQGAWIPAFLQRIDRAPRNRRWSFPTTLTLKPSDYFHRQVFATFVDDPVAVRNLELIGAENLMWSSDYPHNASSWPRSREIVERDFKGMDAAVRRKVLRDNVTQLYGVGGAS